MADFVFDPHANDGVIHDKLTYLATLYSGPTHFRVHRFANGGNAVRCVAHAAVWNELDDKWGIRLSPAVNHPCPLCDANRLPFRPMP